VHGQVQGVGFRPFVYRLALELSLSGWVRNDARGVEIEVQGDGERIAAFLDRLQSQAPPLARIDRIEQQVRALESHSGFLIDVSRPGPAATGIAPDSAVCDACVAELFDPADRRYRYAFINCTHCGPRYTITGALPYDRPQTSMARFALCASCDDEYRDPLDRRFHAQPNACPACGPRLTLLGARGTPVATADPIAETVARLARGEILAVKGLGGFHLVCDAHNPGAVARLRARKDREEKPFAVMVANLASAERFVNSSDAERALLAARERPIVLCRKRRSCDAALQGVAPGLEWLGMMLPYTPLQYLLFHEAAGRPAGIEWLGEAQPLALVMTSANPGGEPLVIGNDEAVVRLAGIADSFLVHDREILIRCDDSVIRAEERSDGTAAAPNAAPAFCFIRRARGYTPQAIALGAWGPAVLAVGGYLKNAVCLTRGDQAFLSQHIGDLDNRATCIALEEAVAHLADVLQIEPEAIACDRHPDFFSTRFAAAYAGERGIPLIEVQHHHAHIAAVTAEHGVRGPVLGLALDGVGLGSDGGIWGGELLLVDGPGFERIGHLHELHLAGGDRAAREPWRLGAAALHALGRGEEIPVRFAGPAAEAVRQILVSGRNAPPTSSAGRLFDAAAGLLGVKPVSAYEGQAAMLLEGLAERHGPVDPLRAGWSIEENGVLSLLPLLARLADEHDAGLGASLFHATLAAALAAWVANATARTRSTRVALGGGCFLNRLLSRALRARLEAAGYEVLEARRVPPNDGGLSLGQAHIARCRLGMED
jgi:hydrogenase maturation protein HypF